MAKDLENRGIRSDKVRNIMEEEPPIVIRYGTAIIVAMLLAVAIFAFYINKRTPLVCKIYQIPEFCKADHIITKEQCKKLKEGVKKQKKCANFSQMSN